MPQRRTQSPTALLILALLRLNNGPLSVSDLVEQTQGATETIRETASKLAHQGLIIRRYEGLHVFYSLPDQGQA